MTPAAFDLLARALLEAVGDTAIRVLPIAGVTALAMIVFRRQPARFRLTAWTVVLCAALALPLVPAWSISVPVVPVVKEHNPPSPSARALPATSVPSHEPVALTTVETARTNWSWPTVAAAIYLIGVALLLFQGFIGWWTTRRLRLSAQAVTDADTLARIDRCSSKSGLKTSPHLLESPDLFVPVTMSVRRPIVILPMDWRSWPEGKLEAVLAHELAHIARCDVLRQRVSLFYRALVWFSPLSWWLHQHLADLADQASDDAALEAGIDPVTYAGTLVDFFARLQPGAGRALWHVAMASRADTDAANRVERILNWKGGTIMSRSKLSLVVVGLITLPVVGLSATVRLAASQATVLPVPPVWQPVSSQGISSLRPTRATLEHSSPARVTATQTGKKTETGRESAPASAVSPQTQDDFGKGAYESNTRGLVAPKIVKNPMPKYTPEAMRAKVQGKVVVEIIIGTDGTVEKARIQPVPDGLSGLSWRPDATGDGPAGIKQLGESALATAREWTFEPGMLNGQPVRVRVSLVLEFRLH